MATYDRLQVKASHNSYSRKRRLSLAEQLDGVHGDPAAPPCRGIELDIVQHPSRLQWQVAHNGPWDPDDPARKLLSVWLRRLERWCEGNPGHPVITVHLDLKNAPRGIPIDDYSRGLDEYVERALGRDRIYGPADMIGGAPDLVTAARAGGWPEETFLADKVIVCLSGRYKRKHHYSDHEPRDRLCFTDRSWAWWDQPPPTRGAWVFLNVLVTNRKPRWSRIAPFVSSRGFVVRGFNIVNPRRWRKAKDEGLQVLATDELRDPAFVL